MEQPKSATVVNLFENEEGKLVFPTSTTQSSFWFFDLLNPGNSALNIDTCWELNGAVDADMVERAFQTIIDRHEVLRTRLIERDGVPMQEVVDVEFKIDHVDMTHIEGDMVMNYFNEHLYKSSHTPHDTSRVPTVVVEFIKFTEDRAFVACYIHHAFFDGGSMGILGKEFEEILVALVEERAPKLPELPLQFGDYALWQKEYLEAENFDDEISYWKSRLEGIPYFEVAPDHERTQSRRLDGYLRTIDLTPQFTKELETAARNQGTTMFSFGAAVGMALLHRLTDQDDIVVTTQVSTRNAVELENMIGGFVNNLVLRFDASGDPSFGEFSQRTSKAVFEALIHQQMPFQKLNELLNPSRDNSRAPLTSINFESAITDESTQNLQHDKFSLKSLPFASTGTIYDLNFIMIDWGEFWRMGIEYNPDLFDADTIDEFLGYWKKVMEIAVSTPEMKLSAIPIESRSPETVKSDPNELHQITRSLEQHGAIASAASVLRENADGEQKPYAFVTPSKNYQLPLESLPAMLMQDLATKLSHDELPFGISVLVDFPLNSEGHVDHHTLPSANLASPSLATPDTSLAIVSTSTVNVAPQITSSSEIKQLLLPIWQDVLGIENVDPELSFFDQGGHSMLAVKMLSRVRKTFDQSKVNVATLFEAPTLNEFSEHMTKLSAPLVSVAETPDKNFAQLEWETIKVQPKGNLTPIIGINQSMLYYTMSRRIGEDRPFFDVQIKGENILSGNLPDLSFEEIASGCVEQIRKVQPSGPYILFGHCVNGHIAYEVAQQLKRAGEEISLLGMVDCSALGYIEGLPPTLYKRWHWAYRYAKLRYTINQYRTTDLGFKEVFLSKIGMLRRFTDKLPGDRWSLQITTEELIDQKLSKYLMAARANYDIEPYDGTVLNVITETLPKMRDVDSHLGWDPLLKGHYSMPQLPGWHQDIFNDPSATLLANHLQRMLRFNP